MYNNLFDIIVEHRSNICFIFTEENQMIIINQNFIMTFNILISLPHLVILSSMQIL